MSDSTPICRCRVLYLGSTVPRQSKDGLQGIQEPLRNLYPPEGAIGAKGIDSWLSVWSNGILMENVNENLQNITRFFPIESLHYCAAVRRVLIPDRSNSNADPKFLPLDSPFARTPRAQHPPIFSAILRRTSGIKVLECHAFICKREAAANALVRCCFHAYADNSYLQQIEICGKKIGTYGNIYCTLTGGITHDMDNELTSKHLERNNFVRNSEPLKSLNKTNGQSKYEDISRDHDLLLNVINDNTMEGYTSVKNYYGNSDELSLVINGMDSLTSNANGNHKIWNGLPKDEENSTVESSQIEYTTASLSRTSRSRQISVPIQIEPPPNKDEKAISLKETKRMRVHESKSLSGSFTQSKHVHENALQRNNNTFYGPSVNQEFHRQITQQPIVKRMNTTHRNLPSSTFSKEPYNHSPNYSNINLYFPTSQPRLICPEYATLQSSISLKQQKVPKNFLQARTLSPVFSYQHPCENQCKLQPINVGVYSPVVDLKLPSMTGSIEETLNSNADTFGGTGIYRRRGHLNERAFSYSIRQEHRSRSHGSLAGLKFSTPEKSKLLKAEQEVSQMVEALQLCDEKSN